MSKPRPLSNLSSARAASTSYQSLTPRTPHSRSGRADDTFTEIELEQVYEVDQNADDDYRTYGQQHTRPLLSSSSSSDLLPVGRGHEKRKIWRGPALVDIVMRLPLVFGTVTAGFLLMLIVASYKRPDELARIIGATAPQNQATQGEAASASTPAQADMVSPSSAPVTSEHATHPGGALISYENYTTFPLLPTQYRDECKKLHKGFMTHAGYWDTPMRGSIDVEHHDEEQGGKKVCDSTVTYMLDGHVGLLADLALMAQVAAMARERNRTFFVDDTYWNRGIWTHYFQDVHLGQPAIQTNCIAPPQELVACPRTARHWVVNSRTAKYHLGHAFSENYENPYGQGLHRLMPIYDRALESFTHTIRPNARIASLIRAARKELSNIIKQDIEDDFGDDRGTMRYVGVHIRRGDRRPSSWSYHGEYIPVSEYVQATKNAWNRINHDVSTEPVVYVASDSPSAQSEFLNSFPAGNTLSLAQSKDADLKTLTSPGEYFQKTFDQLTESQRKTATEGMIVDFALLSGMWASPGEVKPDGVICTIGSSVCRMAAVGLGWEKAFGRMDRMGVIDDEGKRWVEIDEKGAVVPIWQAFELFN